MLWLLMHCHSPAAVHGLICLTAPQLTLIVSALQLVVLPPPWSSVPPISQQLGDQLGALPALGWGKAHGSKWVFAMETHRPSRIRDL